MDQLSWICGGVNQPGVLAEKTAADTLEYEKLICLEDRGEHFR